LGSLLSGQFNKYSSFGRQLCYVWLDNTKTVDPGTQNIESVFNGDIYLIVEDIKNLLIGGIKIDSVP